MADDIASLQIRILSQDVEAANRRLQSLERQSQETERSVGRLGSSSKLSFGAIASGAASMIGISAATGVAVSQWLAYDKAMKEVKSISTATGAEFRTMRKDVLELASAIGVDATVAAKGLYQALSAGIPKENAMAFLTTAAKSAVAGVTTVNVAVDGLTNVINAYKLPVADAAIISDKLFAAVVDGKTTFEELSANMSKATVVAAAMGVPLDQVLAAIVAITGQGTPTAEAFTQIKEALTSLLNPSDQMLIAFKQMEVTSGSQAVAQYGLAGALQLVRDRFEGQEGELVKAMRSTEAYNGMLSMTGENLKSYDKGLKSVAESTGKTNKAFADNANTLENAFSGLKTTFIGFVEALEGSYGPIQKVTGLLKTMTGALAAYQELQARGTVETAGAVRLGGTGGAMALQQEIARLEKVKKDFENDPRSSQSTILRNPFAEGLATVTDQLSKARAAMDGFSQDTLATATAMRELNEAVAAGDTAGADAAREKIASLQAYAQKQTEVAKQAQAAEEESKVAREEKVKEADILLKKEEEAAKVAKEKAAQEKRDMDALAGEAVRLATTERERLDLQIKNLEALKAQRPEMAAIADEAISAVQKQLAAYNKSHDGNDNPIKKALAVDEEALAEKKDLHVRVAEEIAESEYQIAMRAQERLANDMKESIIGRHQFTLNAVQDFFGNMASLTSSHSEKAFKVGQAFAIAQATMQMFQSAVGAYAQGSAISPFLGPVFAAAALAAGAGNIASIKAQKFQAYEYGGMIPAGAVGLVGEAGPEFVRGPAVVTSAKATAGLRGGDSGGKGVTVIVNNAPGYTAEVTSKRTSDGELVEIAITRTIDKLTAEVSNGGGSFVPALASKFNLRRNGNSK